MTAIRKLEAAALAAHGDLEAILDEHVPEELRARCWSLVDDLTGNAYAQANEGERTLYGALIALLPEHVKQVRAAYSATIFAHDEDDWDDYERGLAWTICSEQTARRLMRGRGFDV